MPEPRTASSEHTDLSRRDFLVSRLPARLAALLGSGAAASPADTTAEATSRDPIGSFSPRDLARMNRDEVKAALVRIGAQRRIR